MINCTHEDVNSLGMSSLTHKKNKTSAPVLQKLYVLGPALDLRENLWIEKTWSELLCQPTKCLSQADKIGQLAR